MSPRPQTVVPAHRRVRLSIGDVVDGRLQCRYHGLQFDGSGQCRMVPFERLERIRAQAPARPPAIVDERDLEEG